jgi:hypothetical protein
MIDPTWNPDFTDMLRALVAADVQFLVVGAHAMAVHGVPRATVDLDIWLNATSVNSDRIVGALLEFGAPLHTHGITREDFIAEGTVYQLGLPPSRIDLLTSISGVTFDSAWPGRVTAPVADMDIPFIGREALIENKQASARDKDLIDLDLLRKGTG